MQVRNWRGSSHVIESLQKKQDSYWQLEFESAVSIS